MPAPANIMEKPRNDRPGFYNNQAQVDDRAGQWIVNRNAVLCIGHCGRTTSHFAAAGCDSGGEPRSRDAQQGCPRAIRQKPECEAQLHIYDYLSASTMQGLFGLDACPCCSEINVPIDFDAVAAI